MNNEIGSCDGITDGYCMRFHLSAIQWMEKRRVSAIQTEGRNYSSFSYVVLSGVRVPGVPNRCIWHTLTAPLVTEFTYFLYFLRKFDILFLISQPFSVEDRLFRCHYFLQYSFTLKYESRKTFHKKLSEKNSVST